MLLTAAAATFDALITTDRGIPHQQNLSQYEVAIVLMEARSNRIEDLAPLVPKVKAQVRFLVPGTVLRVTV